MRIDPVDIFAHTMVSAPLRFCLAWLVGTLGSFAPVFLVGGMQTLQLIGWQLLFFPFYLFLVAMFSGWWSFIAVPLLVVWAWKAFAFMKDEGTTKNLLWIFILPFLISIRTNEDVWPWPALVAVILLLVFVGGPYLSAKYGREASAVAEASRPRHDAS